ncbi:oligosaccharide flippase family protein [Avrilella dinanensis]|uniref:Polysaccharide biosynthesis protein C-terminal domain-containing protein n=1 Tax=Avrilella dinanensis TaxID=2008672 RepID=A0A2M9R7W6_9FLAO|nr:oligosaccharide flippase family protein [Avrilella dinanensis]PJR04936.1 hypothetical protein CDL10_10570 [Avrilella dinanensis]
MNGKKEYRNILQKTSVFGYVQLVSLLTGIVRSKIAAFWLGTQGVGILGLLSSSFSLIIAITSFGLPTSIIKLLSKETDDETITRKIYVISKIICILGIIGSLLCFIFSKQLSSLAFDTDDFTWAFQLLSVSVFFKQIFSGYISIFQATNKLKLLANVNIIANIVGILITIPLYYYFRINGIFYNFLIITIVEVIIIYFALKYNNYAKIRVHKKEIIQEAKPILSSSITFSFTGTITLLSIYLVQVYISKAGNLEEVGLYVAAFTILNSYIGLVFVVMGNEYFPRIAKNNITSITLNLNVNQQLYIGLLIVIPMLLWLITLAPLVINILYSESFSDSIHLMKIASLGIFFKVFSWTLGYVILVKASNRFIILNSTIFNLAFLGLHVTGFYFFRLTGVAYAFSLYFFIHFIGNLFITHQMFNFRMNKEIINYLIISGTLLVINILISLILEDTLISNIFNGLSALIISLLSLKKILDIYKK